MMADCLDQHTRRHAFGCPLHQFHREAPADAVAHEKKLPDPKMVHQAQLVVGKCVPRVGGRNRAGGLAAVRVALIHRDAAKLVLEYLHRVENRSAPIADARVKPAAGDEEQGEAGTSFLITNSDIAFLVKRHGYFSSVALCHEKTDALSLDSLRIEHPTASGIIHIRASISVPS